MKKQSLLFILIAVVAAVACQKLPTAMIHRLHGGNPAAVNSEKVSNPDKVPPVPNTTGNRPLYDVAVILNELDQVRDTLALASSDLFYAAKTQAPAAAAKGWQSCFKKVPANAMVGKTNFVVYWNKCIIKRGSVEIHVNKGEQHVCFANVGLRDCLPNGLPAGASTPDYAVVNTDGLEMQIIGSGAGTFSRLLNRTTLISKDPGAPTGSGSKAFLVTSETSVQRNTTSTESRDTSSNTQLDTTSLTDADDSGQSDSDSRNGDARKLSVALSAGNAGNGQTHPPAPGPRVRPGRPSTRPVNAPAAWNFTFDQMQMSYREDSNSFDATDNWSVVLDGKITFSVDAAIDRTLILSASSESAGATIEYVADHGCSVRHPIGNLALKRGQGTQPVLLEMTDAGIGSDLNGKGVKTMMPYESCSPIPSPLSPTSPTPTNPTSPAVPPPATKT